LCTEWGQRNPAATALFAIELRVLSGDDLPPAIPLKPSICPYQA